MLAQATSWLPELVFHHCTSKGAQDVQSSDVRRGDPPLDGQLWGKPYAPQGLYALPPVVLLGWRLGYSGGTQEAYPR